MNVNKELIRLWIDALRSGNYEQGIYTLRDIHNKFCCLGVLCDVAKELVNLDWELESPTDLNYVIGDTASILPTELAIELGGVNERIIIVRTNSKLQEYLGSEVDTMLRHTTLVALNDYYKLSFDQIADILEEEFLNETTTTNVA